MTEQEKKRILIIEDDPGICLFARITLEVNGFAVIEAGNAEEGLQMAGEHGISLVLLDLRLPREDGLWVIQSMKSDLRLASIPVIVFSASAELEQRIKMLAAGVSDYLVKPVSAAQLADSVKRALSAR